MAVLFDAGSANVMTGGNGVTSLTTPAFTITSAANRAGVIGFAGATNTTGLSGSIGGVTGAIISGANGTTVTRTAILGVVALPSGSQTATVSWTTAQNAEIGVIVASGVAQGGVNAGSFNAGVTSAAGGTSLAVTSAAGDLTTTVFADSGTASSSAPTSTQARKWSFASVSRGLGCGGDIGPGTGTTTHTWTVNDGGVADGLSGANFVQVAGVSARARIFGVPLPYRSEYRRDVSAWFRSRPLDAVPPRAAFLTTPEPKRPPGEGSIVFPAASLITAQPPVVPAFLTTPEAFRQPSRLQVSIIRGAGTLPAPVSPPPVIAFLTTQAANRETLKDASVFFKPIFLQFDPLGGGAFFATVVPWRDRNLADASILFAPRQPAILDFPEIRRFHAVPFMEPPRREGSVIFLPPALFASVAPLIEIKNRWIETPVPWRYWPGARHDASWVTVYPQPPQVQPPPSPRAGNVAPQWLRRRRLLFGI